MNTIIPGIQSLTLYHYPATRSARVKWMLHETVGNEFKTVATDLYAGVQYSEAFLAKNPNHNVPVLEIEFTDGRVMTMLESAAMVAFLADAYPELKLAPLPGSSQERADYLQMLQFGGVTIDMMLWQIRIHEHVLPKAERDERTAQRYRQKFIAEIEPQLAARLASGGYICGDAFTAADCIIGHDVTWARGYGLCQDELFRNYLSRISKRPAFRAAFADAASFNPQPPKVPGGKVSFNG